MKKRGSVLPYILILMILTTLGIWYYNKHATLPPKFTQDTAAAIYIYPNSKEWKIENKKGLCTFSAKNCTLSSRISFTSEDDWATIYRYYAANMQDWKTNSTVYTSIPTGILFTNESGCEAELTPKRKGIFEFAASNNGPYYFNVTCPS